MILRVGRKYVPARAAGQVGGWGAGVYRVAMNVTGAAAKSAVFYAVESP